MSACGLTITSVQQDRDHAGIQPAVAAALDAVTLPDRFTMYIATEPVA